MTYRKLSFSKQFDTILDLGIETLVVSGCSFTYNNSDRDLCSWPYYLKDLAGFSQVIDCSLPGAGNYHIAHSLQWELESNNVSPDRSLIVVMWSGADRDDLITTNTNIDSKYAFRYDYNQNVSSAITGGRHPNNTGNTILGMELIKKSKTDESRAVENYLYMSSTHGWLKSQGYRFLFLDYHSQKPAPNSTDIDISLHLPKLLVEKKSQMFAQVESLGSWSQEKQMLDPDGFHPSPDAHLAWTREILLPYIGTLNISESPTSRA